MVGGGSTQGSKTEGFSHEEVARLRHTIATHLKETDVYSKVRALVDDYLRSHKSATQEEALTDIQQRGLLDQVVAEFPKAGSLRYPAPSAHTLDLSRRHLHIRISQGRGFTSHLQLGAHPKGERLALSLALLGCRHVSRPVHSSAEPPFDEVMLLDLNQAAGSNCNGPPVSLRDIMRLSEELRISCIKITPEGQSLLVGLGSVEWRHCLCRASASPCVVELHGPGHEAGTSVGVLHLSLSLVPRPSELDLLPTSLLRDQARLVKGLRAEALTRFISAAKLWWRDFAALCPSHRDRLVKVLARGEDGEQLPVCKFVRPFSGGRLLGTPREAARMVSLLGIQEDSPIGGTAQEAWCNMHTLLTRGCGAKEEHALLLTALLLGFGLDAYVCVGKDRQGAGAAWVVTRGGHSHTTIWDPLNALRYGDGEDMLPLARCPYQTLGCVFNHKVIAANLQADDSLAKASFNTEDPNKWHLLSAEADLDAIDSSFPTSLRASQIDAPAVEEEVESQLRSLLEAHHHQLAPSQHEQSTASSSSMWDEQLGQLLMPALVAYESEILNGVAPGNEEFQQAIKRAVPTGHTFKGYPRQFNHQSAARMAETLMREKVPHEILSTEGQSVCFGLRVKIFSYPEDLTSVWVMLAVKYRGIHASS
mmetsp:Transcript_16697/g.23021  ORF Transcript_16697/g.23021 Transcript_16697/m.23021 type:complete len:648 (-) Transcript_16697:166-2109(-)